jgi:L-ornithine Nalpha-acyltransferase
MNAFEIAAPSPDALAAAGALEARLARGIEDIEAAQRLRYDVFYREMSAVPSPEMAASGRDFDRYDSVCDHLVVFDRETGACVACYRLLRKAVAEAHGGFYTSGEYDIAAMLASAAPDAKFLELGRSCVARAYRNTQTMQFLWRALMVYLVRNEIELMFGCASLPGTDPGALKLELAYLHHFHAMPEAIRVRARGELYEPMDLMPREAIDEAEALRALPPLVKGYVRAGAMIGEGAVVDRQFGTTDVFIYLPTSRLDARWKKFFTKRAGV